MANIASTAAAQSDQVQDQGYQGNDSLHVSFHPNHITITTFRELLSRYPSTVEQAHSRRVRLKLSSKSKSKSTKGSKRKVEINDNPASASQTLDPSEEKHIREETDNFLQLDQWRYETLPGIIAKRKDCSDEENRENKAYLLKEELIDIMEWKLKHGVFRPMLMGMVKNNQAATVVNSTSTAFAVLPDADPVLAPSEAFPKASMDALTGPLRGIGPATASLILSIATVLGDARKQVPFYSDDVYLWLCLMDFPEPKGPGGSLVSSDGRGDLKEKKVSQHKKPNGELIAKYNMIEYQALWHACQELRTRLNKNIEDTSEDGSVSLIDIERVAYVLRNIDVSGYYVGQSPNGIAHPMKSPNSLSSKVSKSDPGEPDRGTNKRPKQSSGE